MASCRCYLAATTGGRQALKLSQVPVTQQYHVGQQLSNGSLHERARKGHSEGDARPRTPRYLTYPPLEFRACFSATASGDNIDDDGSSSPSSGDSGSDGGGAKGGRKKGWMHSFWNNPSKGGQDDGESTTGKNQAVIPMASRIESLRKLLVVPLPRRPLLPGNMIPISTADTKLIEAVVAMKQSGQAYVATFLLKNAPVSTSLLEQPKIYAADDLVETGTLAQVHLVYKRDDGGQLLLMGHRRIVRTDVESIDPLHVFVRHLKDNPYQESDEIKATKLEVIATLKDLISLNPLHREQLAAFVQYVGDFEDPAKLADLGAFLTSAEGSAIQGVLECLDVPERLRKTLLLIKKEVDLGRLQADISRKVEEQISGQQRRFFLMEQLRSIKRELGLENDEKSVIVDRFRERVEPIRASIPPEVLEVIEEQLEKLSGLEASSSEFGVTRNYLDWLTALPWAHHSEENLDVDEAARVLDEDHYGLQDVKERILEFIAVGKLRGTTQGKILCLSGPPGTGKTSIGRSIARALNRKFFRFSVGGLGDVAEIKGHRRTYVGAMPGKMVQCLKATGTNNPLVLIDEIDKLGRGHQGDPASALLELLDPEQNASFRDHYLDVPVDLSKVLFVCTANVTETIPGPLLDRMEVIRVAGYISEEKQGIARQYLEPEARKKTGIVEGQVEVEDGAIKALIDKYCREAGVRNLQKHLEKIYRKIALKLVRESKAEEAKSLNGPATASDGEEDVTTPSSPLPPSSPSSPSLATSSESFQELVGKEQPSSEREGKHVEGGKVVVTADNLKDYVGHPVFNSDRVYESTPVGVVVGLAWTSMGGSTLFVETGVAETGDGKGRMKTTGQLGDVMRESSDIAYTYARQYLAKLAQRAKGTAHKRAPGSNEGAQGEAAVVTDATTPASKRTTTQLAALASEDFFSTSAIHMHVPEGATPKDGPSAGTTMTTALLSLALGIPVRPGLAMTGELTLTGSVLPIGGVREKTVAARRSELDTILLPAANQKDWEELPEYLRHGLKCHFVKHYDEVFQHAFLYDDAPGGNALAGE
eukprot:jgi/Mesvir1/9666/Mv12151-RA.1